MIKVEVSAVINRPVEEIFDYMSNPENSPKWQSGVLEAEQTSKGPTGVGATTREVRKFMGRQIDQTFEITEYEPNRLIRQKTISGPMKLDTIYAFESAEGGTRVTMGGEGDSGGFFMLADPLINRMAKRQMEADLANLKDMLEAQE